MLTLVFSLLELWPLLRLPLLTGMLAGVTLGAISVFIIAARQHFFCLVLAQTSTVGALIGTAIAGLTPLIVLADQSPLVFALGLTLLMTSVLKNSRQPEWSLAFYYLAASALTLIISPLVTHHKNQVQSFMFGSAVVVSEGNFQSLLVICTLSVLILLMFLKGFQQIIVDREHALLRRMPVSLLETLFWGMLAVVIAVSAFSLGVLPVFAYSVIPGSLAVLLMKRLEPALVVAGLAGGFGGAGGYLVAFGLDLPVGASQVLTLCVFYLLVVSYQLLRHNWFFRQK